MAGPTTHETRSQTGESCASSRDNESNKDGYLSSDSTAKLRSWGDRYAVAMSEIQMILIACAVAGIVASIFYGWHRVHRRQIRQQQCFEALQVTCPVCGALGGAPCVDRQGTPTFLHWPRVTASVQPQQLTAR
jgi:hypothetical protein